VGLPFGFATLVIVAWEMFCRIGKISPVLLPPPSAV
jgi:ABC-type nitrate/sulfonate/bicarbonate transport system permease component